MSNKFYKCDKCGVFDVPEDAEVKVCGGEAPKELKAGSSDGAKENTFLSSKKTETRLP